MCIRDSFWTHTDPDRPEHAGNIANLIRLTGSYGELKVGAVLDAQALDALVTDQTFAFDFAEPWVLEKARGSKLAASVADIRFYDRRGHELDSYSLWAR